MAEGDRQQETGAVGSGESERGLKKALGAHEVGLEMRAERIASPSHARSAEAGAAQEGIIEDGADGSLGRQFGSRRRGGRRRRWPRGEDGRGRRAGNWRSSPGTASRRW